MGDRLLQTALARALGVTPAVVSRDAKRGMPVDSVEAAKAWRLVHVRARINHKRPERADGTAAGAVRLPGEGGGDDPPDGYWKSRARREAADAEASELRVAELRGDLVRADVVRRSVSSLMATLRDSLLQIPARLVPVVTAETDPAVIDSILRSEICGVLSQVSGEATQ